MRVSEYYNLGRTQPALDFVDIDITEDTPVYIDPSAIKNLSDEWATQCLNMLSTFFDSVLDAINNDDQDRVKNLLIRLQEPNETHFGLSKGKSRGRGLGPYLIQKLCNNLTLSRAAKTGMLEDLEDTALFIEGVGKDIVSDLTTNVIRGMLVTYTQSVALMYGIPLEEGVYSGLAWDPFRREWDGTFTRLPIADGNPLLLVPKVIVRYDLHLTKEEYFRNYLAPAMQSEELDKPGSKLVKTLKDGQKVVQKKDVEQEYGGGKEIIASHSFARPEVFQSYKEGKRLNPSKPLTHDQISAATQTPRIDLDALLHEVLTIPPGPEGASAYHRAVESLLSALFYPALSQPVIEFPIDQGRKRVDITYTNMADSGFFGWLQRQRHQCSYVFVECKNYKADLGNPELDQITGRFSHLRGQVGLILCRSLQDKPLFIARCRDVALASRGFVLALDDEDLRALVNEEKMASQPVNDQPTGEGPEGSPQPSEFRTLFERFRQLVS
ncbi:hypothetical protein P3T36_003970 [Kitasatospora sp. MAP12-15]|uniref:hypothetical protein n=1 Tax=unclassified Kitasatospora TaxID=2633591 RepID=UPI002472EB33|nr:hypothetical protein [Kitasatospora sp. MAP12-44]MDH6108386.1 hypothetical protein [Kitasatospora sp. MAP12-44]